MAITIDTQPNTYSYGYSAIPIKAVSDNLALENLKYLVNITYDEATYSSDTVTSLNGKVVTEITTSAAHSFELGDKVMFYNPNTPDYTGIYTVLDVPSSTTFVIDLVQGAPIVNTTPSYFYKVVSYKLLPDPDGEIKMNISNSIKDFVTQDFESTDEIFEAPSTFFDYGITIGEEYKYTFEFTDNAFVTGGTVAFINPSLTSGDVDDSPFKVGDRINIQQDLYVWDYDTTTTTGGNLTFVSATTDHGFRVGDLITTSGEITNPSYNGETTVLSAPTTKSIEVNKAYISATAEPGKVFGVITPSYNTVATITDIYWDVTNGYVVETDLAYDIATPAIGGKIKFADDRITKNYVDQRVTGLTAFNSGLTKRSYGFGGNDFDPYVVQNRAFASNDISAVFRSISTSYEWRIEPETKSWLLCHTNGLGVNEANIIFGFFDSSGALLNGSRMNNYQQFENFYFPIGIDQVIANSDVTLIGGSALSTVRDDIAYYIVSLERLGSSLSNEITFTINTDCAGYELYHLCWKDRYGSWISYPFKYIQENITEFERKTYYQQEGRFDSADDFGYDKFGRGDTTYYSRSRDKMKLNSGWIDETENELIKDLLGSSSVMVQLPSGIMVGCTIVTNSYKFGKSEDDGVWNVTLEVRLANNEYRF